MTPDPFSIFLFFRSHEIGCTVRRRGSRDKNSPSSSIVILNYYYTSFDGRRRRRRDARISLSPIL